MHILRSHHRFSLIFSLILSLILYLLPFLKRPFEVCLFCCCLLLVGLLLAHTSLHMKLTTVLVPWYKTVYTDFLLGPKDQTLLDILCKVMKLPQHG